MFAIAIYFDTTRHPTITFEVALSASEVGVTVKGGETPASDTGVFAKTIISVENSTRTHGKALHKDALTTPMGSCLGEKSPEESSTDEEGSKLI